MAPDALEPAADDRRVRSVPAAGSAGDQPVADRRAEVWQRLDTVDDPELDEPVTDLNFVTGVELEGDGLVRIGFRLPTYWCAPNFSFLMADDMRRAVLALPWVRAVAVTLGEHMEAEKINAGLARGLTFQETFGAEADGDLDTLRRTFLLKAFQRRQYALLRHLVAAGLAPAVLIGMTIGELALVELDADGQLCRTRYLDRRAVVSPASSAALAFVDVDAAPLKRETFETYLTGLRRVGVNAEFNGALCRGLLAVRFDLETPFVPRGSAAGPARPVADPTR